jgi:hypothetical protein
VPKYHEAIESMRSDATKMLERLYGPLVKQLDLPAEKGEKFYQLLLENKMDGFAQRADLLRHESISKLSEQAANSKKEMEAGLQALLGEANFAQYQKYQAGIADRGRLEMVKCFFAESPLTDDQQQLLLRAMETARNALGDGGSIMEFRVSDNGNVMDQKLARQESINQRVLAQAAAFLSPAQLQVLASTQARMLAQAKEGYLKMRATFASSAKPGP